jgi:hypothetical protein
VAAARSALVWSLESLVGPWTARSTCVDAAAREVHGSSYALREGNRAVCSAVATELSAVADLRGSGNPWGGGTAGRRRPSLVRSTLGIGARGSTGAAPKSRSPASHTMQTWAERDAPRARVRRRRCRLGGWCPTTIPLLPALPSCRPSPLAPPITPACHMRQQLRPPVTSHSPVSSTVATFSASSEPGVRVL